MGGVEYTSLSASISHNLKNSKFEKAVICQKIIFPNQKGRCTSPVYQHQLLIAEKLREELIIIQACHRLIAIT